MDVVIKKYDIKLPMTTNQPVIDIFQQTLFFAANYAVRSGLLHSVNNESEPQNFCH